MVSDEECTATVSDSVKVLQRCLRRLGYFPVYAPDGSGKIKINGKYCYYTTKAVRDFQKAQGLTQTGVFDERTKSALIKKICPTYDGSGGTTTKSGGKDTSDTGE